MNSHLQLDPSRWLDDYGDKLYGFAMKAVKNPELARDLVQDTLLAALEKKETYLGKSTISTWLVSILKNKIIDHYRKAATRTTESSDNLEPIINRQFTSFSVWRVFVPNWASDPETISEQAGFLQTLQDCMEKLPKNSKEALRLRSIEGVETEQVCNALGISPSNLGVMIYRARMALRECIETNWFRGSDAP